MNGSRGNSGFGHAIIGIQHMVMHPIRMQSPGNSENVTLRYLMGKV